MRRYGRCGVLAAAGILLLTACGPSPSGPSPTPTPSPVPIARVGATTITEGQLDIRLSSVVAAVVQGGAPQPKPGSAMLGQLRAKVLMSLISDTVIGQEAAYRGIAATAAEVDAEVAQDTRVAGGSAPLAQQLSESGGSIAQLRDEITSRLNEEHLENAFAQQRATVVEQQLGSGTAFATAALEYSDDTASASKGGDLGVLSDAQLQAGDPSFAAAVRALPAGGVSAAPVRDGDGYEILHLIDTGPSGHHVARILVSAARPYTVTSRPRWFDQAVAQAIARLCAGTQIVVLIETAIQPCASTSATPAPTAMH